MKHRLAFRPILVALVLGLGVLWLAALAWQQYSQAGNDRRAGASAGPLAGADIGGPFALVDQDGRPVTDASFDGRYRLIYFGYTYCPDVCPTDVQKMVRGYQAFAARHPDRAGDVRPIFVSIDPERDTPEVVRQFVRAFDPALVGLTGTGQQVEAMLRKYRVYASPQRQPGQSDYLIDHSVVMYLMGRRGEPISFLAADATAEDIEAELQRYVS